MKFFLLKDRDTTNILLSIIITICIFYSGNLGQVISGIETSYIIDTNTLNNSFITLGIKATQGNDKSFQEMRSNIGEQLKQFNSKYEKNEKDRQTKKNIKSWIDRITYVLLLVQIISMLIILKNSKDSANS